MAMRKDPTDQRKDVQEIIYRAYHAIDALEQYNNALHKLEEHFLSESEVNCNYNRNHRNNQRDNRNNNR